MLARLAAEAQPVSCTMGMETETNVYFGVFDFGDDPDVVSALMGVKPTEAWVKGETYGAPSKGGRRTHSRWVLASGLNEGEPIESHLRALLARLEPLREAIDRVQQRFPVQIGVAQYFYEVNPQFRIEPELLRRYASLGVAINFDQYCLGQPEGS